MKYTYDLANQGYHPYQMVLYKGKIKELISFPYPGSGDNGADEGDDAWIVIRDKDDPTTLEYVSLDEISFD